MSVSTTSQDIIPSRVFAAIVAGLVGVVALVAVMRLGSTGGETVPAGAPQSSLDIKVEDGSAGSVIVKNATSGQVIQVFKAGEGAFLRATFRALINDRRHKGLPAEGDFRLEADSAGQLNLIDGVTGKRLVLNAYGPDNSAVFAAFMSNQKGEGQ